MGTWIDFHSHILPGIDDGSAAVEESLAMLRMEAAQGIRHVVATPHFYAQHQPLSEFLERRDRAEQRLRAAMAREPELPRIWVGAEVYFFRGMSQSEVLPQLTIRGTNCILVELPQAPWPEEILLELRRIREERGLIPVVAHVDRYIGPFRSYGIPQQLAQLPVLVQANAAFFLGRMTSPMAMKLLRSDRIHLLGSDCHNMGSRKPNLGDAAARIREKLGDQALSRINGYGNMILGIS